jgi:L-amino acid N-acyltransferase YncA
MDEKTKTAAGIAAGLQGLEYDEKRLAELAAEVEILNDAVRKAAAVRLTFDDDPAAFASVIAKEARS